MEVFLSYARISSSVQVDAVYKELGGVDSSLAFFDKEEIEHGDHFPKRLIDGILDSKVVVIFADESYFKRWYCLLEFKAARMVFDYYMVNGKPKKNPDQSLQSILIVLPSDSQQPFDQWDIPPKLHQIDAPLSNDPAGIAAEIKRRLLSNPPTIREQIEESIGLDKFYREWLAISQLPAPGNPYFFPSVLPYGLSPSLGERFVGRANELWIIHHKFTSIGGHSQGSSPVAVALEGVGGVGKTRLALEYLYRFGPSYFPGGCFWIEAGRSLGTQCYKIAKALNDNLPDWAVVQNEPDGVWERLTKALLTLSPENPALIIINDLPEINPNEAPKPLQEWFPFVGNIRLLVTSRRKESLGNPFVFQLPIQVLPSDAAIQLLQKDINEHFLSNDLSYQIAEWVGFLPLALDLINSSIRHQAFNAKELLNEMISRGTTEILDEAATILRNEFPAGSLKGVTDLFTFSYNCLSESSKEATHLLALLAPFPIPLSVVEQLNIKRIDRSSLITRSFITPSYDSDLEMFGSMHGLLANYIQTKTPDRPQNLTQVTNALLNFVTYESIHTPSQWPLLEYYIPHLIEVYNSVAAEQPRSIFIDHTGWLALHLVSWFIEQGLTNEACTLGLSALGVCKEEVEPGYFAINGGRPALRELIRILPLAFEKNKQYDAAIELRRTYLSWLQQNLENDNIEVLRERDNLANALRLRGGIEDIHESFQIYSKTIELWRIHDPNSKDTLTALNNLALVKQKQGDISGATELFEEVLKGLEGMKNVGQEIITTKMSLAYALAKSDPAHAIFTFKDALSNTEKIQLPDRNELKLTILTGLVEIILSQQDYMQALPLLSRIVKGLEARGDNVNQTDITVWAWNLFAAQLHIKDAIAAEETQTKYLDWLLTTPNEQLTNKLQNLRKELIYHIEHKVPV